MKYKITVEVLTVGTENEKYPSYEKMFYQETERECLKDIICAVNNLMEQM